MDMAGNCKKLLDMAEIAENGSKGQQIARNGWKWLEMVGNDWKWLEMA